VNEFSRSAAVLPESLPAVSFSFGDFSAEELIQIRSDRRTDGKQNRDRPQKREEGVCLSSFGAGDTAPDQVERGARGHLCGPERSFARAPDAEPETKRSAAMGKKNSNALWISSECSTTNG